MPRTPEPAAIQLYSPGLMSACRVAFAFGRLRSPSQNFFRKAYRSGGCSDPFGGLVSLPGGGMTLWRASTRVCFFPSEPWYCQNVHPFVFILRPETVARAASAAPEQVS